MRNPYIPYYSMPESYSQQRVESDNARPQAIFPGDELEPISPTTEPQALTLQSTEYMNGYLRTQIGKKVRVEFLIGTGTLLDKFGILRSVGANFITIFQVETNNLVLCDFYTIKFITFY